MKKIIYTLSALALASLAYADDLKVKGSIVPDAIRAPNNYLILDKQGNQEGWIHPDPLRVWPLFNFR
jgi:hypothetical protein